MEPYQGGTFWYCPANCYRGKNRTKFRRRDSAVTHVNRHHSRARYTPVYGGNVGGTKKERRLGKTRFVWLYDVLTGWHKHPIDKSIAEDDAIEAAVSSITDEEIGESLHHDLEKAAMELGNNNA